MAILLSALLLLGTPPATSDHFRQNDHPAHLVLVVDPADGGIVRIDEPIACSWTAYPPGEGLRLLLYLTALDTGRLRPDETISCDSSCWAAGEHGDVALGEAFANSCDTYAREVLRRVPGAAVRRMAEKAGFGVGKQDEVAGAIPDAATIEAADDFPGAGWRITARQWVRFWTRLERGELTPRTGDAAALLAAAGRLVHSPMARGRVLHRPRRTVRLALGESSAGAWATGIIETPEQFHWCFAVFVPGGTTALAAARTDRVLEKTLRVARRSTHERGGRPLPYDFTPADE